MSLSFCQGIGCLIYTELSLGFVGQLPTLDNDCNGLEYPESMSGPVQAFILFSGHILTSDDGVSKWCGMNMKHLALFLCWWYCLTRLWNFWDCGLTSTWEPLGTRLEGHIFFWFLPQFPASCFAKMRASPSLAASIREVSHTVNTLLQLVLFIQSLCRVKV